MTDERLNSKGNIRFKWYEPGAFANPYWPTTAEMNAGQDLEGVTLWDSFEVNAQASETSDAASIKAKSTVSRRAGANYGGSASFWYAGDHTDFSNLAALVYAIFKQVNRPGYLAVSVDGDIGETGQPPADYTFEHGDYVSIFGVMTDEWTDMITGEEAFFYTRNFIKNGFMRTYTVVSDAAPVLTLTATGTTGAADSVGGITALVNGRNWTRGCTYRSDDPAVVQATPSGAFKLLTAGTADITVTLPRTNPGVSAAETITVS